MLLWAPGALSDFTNRHLVKQQGLPSDGIRYFGLLWIGSTGWQGIGELHGWVKLKHARKLVTGT
jgi:hypothetical protein